MSEQANKKARGPEPEMVPPVPVSPLSPPDDIATGAMAPPAEMFVPLPMLSPSATAGLVQADLQIRALGSMLLQGGIAQMTPAMAKSIAALVGPLGSTLPRAPWWTSADVILPPPKAPTAVPAQAMASVPAEAVLPADDEQPPLPKAPTEVPAAPWKTLQLKKTLAKQALQAPPARVAEASPESSQSSVSDETLGKTLAQAVMAEPTSKFKGKEPAVKESAVAATALEPRRPAPPPCPPPAHLLQKAPLTVPPPKAPAPRVVEPPAWLQATGEGLSSSSSKDTNTGEGKGKGKGKDKGKDFKWQKRGSGSEEKRRSWIANLRQKQAWERDTWWHEGWQDNYNEEQFGDWPEYSAARWDAAFEEEAPWPAEAVAAGPVEPAEAEAGEPGADVVNEALGHSAETSSSSEAWGPWTSRGHF
jgi:hypothetical protein